MAKVDFTLLRQEIKEAARRAFDAVRAAHPDERFYAFALYSDDSAMTVCPSANSVQGLERRVKRYEDSKSYREFLASRGLPFNSDRLASDLRWETAEWAYEYVGHKHFHTVYDMINVDGRYDRDDPDGFVRFKGQVFATMVLGLGDLEVSGYFGTGKEREAITLLCSVSDSACAGWLEEESVFQLNPDAVIEAFWQQRTQGNSSHRPEPGSVHEAFIRHLRTPLP
jgi:hypothetical protein